MGRQIYFTDRELKALIDSASEWCSMMTEGEDTVDYAEERLRDGLGSALYKLYAESTAQDIYLKYIEK